MSPTETDMLDQPSTGVKKFAPSWRFPKLLGYGDAPGAGPDKGRGKTESRTPEERKHQFATWYIFAAFLGVMLVQVLWLRLAQVDTILYSQFEQLVDQNKIAEVLVGQETVLARAVTGEAGVPFFSISGAELVEMFDGVGAARVLRSLGLQPAASMPPIQPSARSTWRCAISSRRPSSRRLPS